MENKDEEKDPWPRDENGEIIRPKLSEEDKEKIDHARYHYVFRAWHEDKKEPGNSGFYPVWNDFREETHSFFKDKTIVHHDVFPIPPKLEDRNAYLDKLGKCEGFLNKYFADVLATNPREQSNGLRFDTVHYHLLEETRNEVIQFIADFNLGEYADFIFFLIAKIQEVYHEDIKFFEQPEELKRIKDFPKEIKKLIKVLDLTERDHQWDWNKKGPPPQLQEVRFKFGYHSPKYITVSDSNLVSHIADSIKKDNSQGSFRDWRKQLEHYPNVYSENEKNNQFRYRLSQALHNFFTEEKIFALDKKNKSSDQEVLCIARILEFGHIQTVSRKDKRIMTTQDDGEDLINVVRNYIIRGKLKPVPKVFTIGTNKEILYKYFDKSIIDAFDNSHSSAELGNLLTICDRLNMLTYFPEIACLFKFILLAHRTSGFFFLQLQSNPDMLPEYGNFIKMVLALNNIGGSLKKVEFTTSDDKAIPVTSNLPLGLIEQALREYIKNHEPDFKVDVVKQENDKLVIKEPYERFLTQFCLWFHNYLKGEVKLTRHDFEPTKKFYLLIGLVLQAAWVFDHHNHDDDYLINKIGQWIDIAKTKPSTL